MNMQGGGNQGGGRPVRYDTTFSEGKCFLGGLDTRTSKESLHEYCSPWGELTDAVVMEGRGFGFVTFADGNMANSFIAVAAGHTIDGKKIEVKKAVPKNQQGGHGGGGGMGGGMGGGGGGGGMQHPGQATSLKLFVGGTGEVSDDEFRSHFADYGELSDCALLRNADGSSRGFGFVTYTLEENVQKVLAVSHVLNNTTVEVKRAIPKGEMGGGGKGMGMGGNPMGGGYGNYGPMQGQGQGQGPQSMQPGVAARPGDWECPGCVNVNFAFRTKCNRCGTDKPNGGMGGGGQGGYGGGMGMGGGMGAYGMDGGMAAYGGMGMGGMGMGGMGGGMGMGYGQMAGYNAGDMGAGMGGMGGYGGYDPSMGGYGQQMGMGGGGGMYGGQGGDMSGGMGGGPAGARRGGGDRYRPY